VRTVFEGYRIADSRIDIKGAVIVEDGLIIDVMRETANDYHAALEKYKKKADMVLNAGKGALLTSAFVDMHAHFREPGLSEKETLESASLAAARGGYGTLVCMANTKPPVDNAEAAFLIKKRADALGFIDLYPAIALTDRMRGKKLSAFLSGKDAGSAYKPLLLSEDGRDVPSDALFLKALRKAKERDIPVSCHCDSEGEDSATSRAIALGNEAGCRLHIAHVSTGKSASLVRKNKNERLTAEATPHHIALTTKDAKRAGEKTFGAVAPALRTERDRSALVEALRDGTIDAIATDHAPHTQDDKARGSPGFSGLETAFSVCNTVLVYGHHFSPQQLFCLLSANPARILGLDDRGVIAKGKKADIVILDSEKERAVRPDTFASRGKNTLFGGKKLRGEILLTMHNGRIVYSV